ncbi:MAG: ABC transporter permease, partial [Mycobacterium sp.]|nr:ABC transporter permease [Mycobacterium sp.]
MWCSVTSLTTSDGRRTSHRFSAPIIITPPKRFRLPALGSLWEAREVLIRFGVRDITLRYRQTALGVAWVILQPLMTAGVFTLVFGKVAKLPTGGVPYFVFSFAGMLAWNVFSGVTSRAAPALVSNASLVSKVFFPRILVPLSTAYSVLVDFAVSLVFMSALLA